MKQFFESLRTLGKGASAPIGIVLYVGSSLWVLLSAVTWPAITVYWGISENAHSLLIIACAVVSFGLACIGAGMLVMVGIAAQQLSVWNPLRYLAVITTVLAPILSLPASLIFLLVYGLRRRD